MSSKRVLKKEIRRVCGNLASECILAQEAFPSIDKEKMHQVVVQIATLQEHALQRVSAGFDRAKLSFDSGREYRAARHAYYQKAFADIKEEFNSRVAEIVKEMNALLPQEVKDANKEANKEA